MNDKYILIGQTPVPEPELLAWARWYEENRESCQVALTKIHGFTVSTVFLGLDHRFHGGGPPILFETMVFGDGKGDDMERCTTWAEAEQMHKRMVARVRERANAGR